MITQTTAFWGIEFILRKYAAVEPLYTTINAQVFRRRILNVAAAFTRAPLRFARDGAYVLDLQKKTTGTHTPQSAEPRPHCGRGTRPVAVPERVPAVSPRF